mgnify:FL=1|tara:strand:- start:34 stop:330 length:297 start_codon:yes stop_codon:yes gene_type:complete
MAIYKNITTETTTTLMTKGGDVTKRVSKILISNNSSSDATDITVNLYDGTNVFYLIRDIVIPSKVSLVLEDNVSFDTKKFNLRISNAGTNPNLTVIIK